MVVGRRVKERMEALNLSQAELARRVGLAQPTIYSLIHRNKVGSKHLHKIARVLQTSPDYLTGDTDDPDENAPPPPLDPGFQPMTFEVLFPSQPALEQMFAGLLMASEGMSLDELAHELSVQLPKALALAQSARPSPLPYRRATPEGASEGSRDAHEQAARS